MVLFPAEACDGAWQSASHAKNKILVRTFIRTQVRICDARRVIHANGGQATCGQDGRDPCGRGQPQAIVTVDRASMANATHLTDTPRDPAHEPARGPRDVPRIRRPSQKRSRERYDRILACTERLLATHSPEELSIHAVADAAGISPPSVYHFFPDLTRLYVALAERYMSQFIEIAATTPPESVRTWQDFDAVQFELARSFYRANPAAAKVMLGPALSLDTRIRDLEGLPLIAQRAAEVAAALFAGPPILDLVDRIVEMIVLSDAIWALSIYRFGDITDEMAARATNVRRAYASTFLPADAAPRQSTQGAATLPANPGEDTVSPATAAGY